MTAPGEGVESGWGSEPSGGDGFEIRIKGRVGETLQGAFSELAITVHAAETVLRGSPLDQAGLYGILERIQSLGLELVAVRRLPGGGLGPAAGAEGV